MAIMNFTSSTVFLTAFIMALTKNNFGIESPTKISTNHTELEEKGWTTKNMGATFRELEGRRQQEEAVSVA
ncbi:MAG: hypothetical protein WCF23_24035 [Candidatus Nitrosopolaris sp.]